LKLQQESFLMVIGNYLTIYHLTSILGDCENDFKGFLVKSKQLVRDPQAIQVGGLSAGDR